jgi:uncharacterized damage-inducible protein DinB
MNVNVAEARAHLARTPGTLRALLSGWSDAWLDAREGPGTYSTRDVLGHLIHGEETDWIPRARIIMEHGEAVPFTPFDREGFRSRYGTLDLSALLDTFETRRTASLASFDALRLAAPDLGRTGTHPEFGKVTLGQLLAAWVVHDFTHVTQIVRVAAKQYGEAVGPWTAYLGVLRRG